MDVGTQWRYSATDLVHHTTKIVEVEIVGNTKLDDGTPARLWVYSGWRDDADTVFVTQVADTVLFFNRRDPQSAYLNRYIVFPIEEGADWGGKQYWSSSAVEGVAPKTVPAGEFRHAFQVYRRGGLPNDYLDHTEWFVPDVGLIYGQYNGIFTLDIEDGLTKSVWELESFSIPGERPRGFQWIP